MKRKMFEDLRNRKTVGILLTMLKDKCELLNKPVKIMEICGTHTVTAYRSGLSKALSNIGIELISGPGCPVCITPDGIVAAAIDLVTSQSNVILTSFGDMLRVPGSKGSLLTVCPARGSSVKIIYSPEEIIKLAEATPAKTIVFLGVGFETTIPSIAYIIKEAHRRNLKNFSMISALRLVPPPLEVILKSPGTKLNGFLYPGHVSVIIGTEPYEFVAKDYNLPGAITGFEPADMLLGILDVLNQIIKKEARVNNAYERVVQKEGNPKALDLMYEIFDIIDAEWRGFGFIPASGLQLKKEYNTFSASKKFSLDFNEGWGHEECLCGEVVKGAIPPEKCALYKKVCTPENPRGPCMVSYEGTCLIHYKYGESKWNV
jgi:hydrogenase expression/formation protein HypD